MKKFYAVIASNGIGIYNSYNKYLDSAMYLTNNNAYKFDEYEEAYDYLVTHAEFPIICDIPDEYPLNRIIYFKDM